MNEEKTGYGESIPNSSFKNLKDNFFGFFRITSDQNTFTWAKEKHFYEMRLNASYRRTGTKPPNGKISYSETEDRLNVQTKYEYRTPIIYGSFYPYVRLNGDSQLYSSHGKHPIRVNVSSGLSKKIPLFWMTVTMGMNGERDYFTNRNTAGADAQIDINHTFAPISILSDKTTLNSQTKVYWYPSKIGKFQFRHENITSLDFQLWKMFGVKFNFTSYSYRDNTRHKLALGYIYDLSLTYGTHWKL